ncbi:D-alanine--D-alanine ligase [Granulicatella seriolae]|uniref:D-alanine--D-alanine ligase n=1 Tax=Granulicatella seriolae TaxID=2967226 RepID=A0ABT1WNT0_9LACT|nr:D-alanine--D-alanine ligase [Granulicatella seriolae]
MKIVVIYGGKSAEHDISILTAFSIIKEIYFDYYQVQPVYITRSGQWLKGAPLTGPLAFEEALPLVASDKAAFATEPGQVSTGVEIKPCDIKEADTVIFPILHGPNGEDGTIQGLFEVLNMPYVGAGVLASACGMDKIVSKYLFQQAGIPQLPFVPFSKAEWKQNAELIYSRIEGTLLYPVFVKPANMGSSVGISKATNREELTQAIQTALKFDRRIVVEQGIDAREIECAVLGNEDVNTSVVGEVVKTVGFYDYNEKYINNTVELQIPAQLSDEVAQKVRKYAATAFRAIDGSGLSRCDFFLTETNDIYINEVNTMPGFTKFSMYPLLWEETGISYKDLVEELIQLALKRFAEKQENQVTV